MHSEGVSKKCSALPASNRSDALGPHTWHRGHETRMPCCLIPPPLSAIHCRKCTCPGCLCACMRCNRCTHTVAPTGKSYRNLQICKGPHIGFHPFNPYKTASQANSSCA